MKKDYKLNSKKTFDIQAEKYDTTFYGQHARKNYKYILNELNYLKEENILDIGCGTGELLYMINKKGLNLYGIDLSDKMIEEAKMKLQNHANLTIGDSENLPYKDNKFDIIICNDSFHHYPNPIKALKEMNRVLKNNGKLIMGDCYQPFISRQIMNIFMKFSKEGDVKIYSKKEFINMFKDSNFKNIKYKKLDNSSCLIKAIK